ncbi:hypothetical protein CBS63078_5666 [Aspergillus niger]|nr:hypothetical protein CBS63078_5666 [Aspergillus niger]KAI2952074.1 hypothetical protein CBS147323_10397 [Aspergillus niger]KAI3026316.1 hypothetical protein CBS147347_4973 [Aspergillus niger]KAI3061055.1 hypothetical protein CBS147353_10112 [Aspergillus niger]
MTLHKAHTCHSSRPVTVLGAGILGRRIAAVFLAGSYTVHLFDPDRNALSAAESFIKSSEEAFTVLTPLPHPERGRLSLFSDMKSAVENAWLVVEAIPEQLPLKVKTFEEVDRYVPVDCILASNSREDLMDGLMEVLEECGMCPIRVRRDSTGFVLGRAWAAIKREILNILAEGVSAPDEIDFLWKEMFQRPTSGQPCQLMDRIGLDTVAAIEDNYIQERGMVENKAVNWLRENYINKGRIGDKCDLGGLYPAEQEGMSEKLYVLDVGIGENNALRDAAASGRILAVSPKSGKMTTLVSGLSYPDGIDISRSCGRMFWTSMGHALSACDGSVQSANLDGSDVRTLLKPGTVHTPKQLVVDDVDHNLYFCDREGMSLHRCNFDGTGHQIIIQSGSLKVPSERKDMIRFCVGVALDWANRRIYWTQKGPSKSGKGRIFRAGMDIPAGQTAGSRTDIECLLEGLPEPVDLEYDTQTHMLYWTDRGEHPTGCSLNRVDVSGDTDKETLGGKIELLARQFHEPIGLKLTKKGVYITDLGGCVYLRPGAVKAGHESELRLAVKQYIPIDNPHPKEGDVTIIGAHANAFPKELYEPLWDDIHEQLASQNRRIRSIWIADVAQQGQSGISNELILGHDPDWLDHGRDLLFMINQFQDQIPQPLVGIGHSMGGMQLAHLSLMHPSLFEGLILLDPVIQRENPGRKFAQASTYRRDLWASREQAAAKFKSNPFYRAWDPRVFERWIQYGLRDLPTPLHPNTDDIGPSAVTLTTTKAQELFYFVRPSYVDERSGLPRGNPEKEMHPDDHDADYPFYRPESAWMFRRLPHLKPPILYLFGERSDLSSPAARQEKVATTGTGLGGSGGAARGLVEEVVLPCGHMVPMELVRESAEASAAFIDKRLSDWESRVSTFRRAWERVPHQERLSVDQQWERHINGSSKGSKL